MGKVVLKRFLEDPLCSKASPRPDATFWNRISHELVYGISSVRILWLLDSHAKAYLCLRQRSLSVREICLSGREISVWGRDMSVPERDAHIGDFYVEPAVRR